MNRMLRGLVLALALITGPGMMSVTRADSSDHERARRAVEAGEVLPLREVLARVEVEHPGQVMELELERDDGMWLYEIKILQAGGVLIKLEVDARDGRVLAIKGQDRKTRTKERP